MQKENILLIINPVAGRKKAKRITYRIVESIYREDYKLAIFITSEKGEAVSIVRENGKAAQKIICCGGDGTLNEVIRGLSLSGLKIPIGYIPTGTTNDLAHSLGLPINTKKAIQTSINGNLRDHDIGSFNENLFFSYIASFGAFTKVVYTTPQKIKNLIGYVAYFFNGILSLGDIKPYTVTVNADGKEIEGEFIYGGVSNSRVFGGIFRLPEREISFNDGMFEVVLIRNTKTPLEFQNLVKNVLDKKYDNRYVIFLKAKKLSFAFKDETAWTIDGEYAGSHKNVFIENMQCAAQIAAGLNGEKNE